MPTHEIVVPEIYIVNKDTKTSGSLPLKALSGLRNPVIAGSNDFTPMNEAPIMLFPDDGEGFFLPDIRRDDITRLITIDELLEAPGDINTHTISITEDGVVIDKRLHYALLTTEGGRKYTPRVQRAINFAERAHRGYTRKISNQPYVTHSTEVTTIVVPLPQITPTDLVVAVDHDIAEDSPYGLGTIKATFGSEVWQSVRDLTDPELTFPIGDLSPDYFHDHFPYYIGDLPSEIPDNDQVRSWLYRKLTQMDRIARMKNSARIIKTADALVNVRNLTQEHARFGNAVYQKFSAGKEFQLWRFTLLHSVLGETATRTSEENPLIDPFGIAVEEFHEVSGEEYEAA